LLAEQGSYIGLTERDLTANIDHSLGCFGGIAMRAFSKIVAIAAIPAWLTVSLSTAAAQNFDDRWSVIPKAHAEPVPPVSDQTGQDQNALPPKAETLPDASENHSVPEHAKRTFTGKASFYSYRKAKTATGASFNRDRLTAAHRSLPFGTKVRVTDVATNKSVVVRITDRGPNIRDRVLDLSLAAARSLGIEDRGVIKVRAEVL
jgi:rare lipoprotein A